MATLHAAADAGVTFFDTADVYGDGRSERLVGRFLPNARARALWWRQNAAVGWPRTRPIIRPAPCANGRKGAGKTWACRTIPLTQLHCPPDGVYEKDAVFDALDEMVSDGILGAYGVSVETVAQGLRAIERPGVATVQVIFNAFRLKPLERLLPACEKADVGVIVRVPLASGLLSGKYTESHDLPARRPPDLQPRWRGVRHRRDFLGRAF